MRRYLRGIRKRLVIHGWQQGNDIQGIFGRYKKFGVIGSQMFSDFASASSLVVNVFMKTDRKSLDRTATLRLHESNDGGRVNFAGEKSSERDIGNHTETDSFCQLCMELLND